MIDLIIGFLVASWYLKRQEAKERKKQKQTGHIGYQVTPFGFLKEDESMEDLI